MEIIRPGAGRVVGQRIVGQPGIVGSCRRPAMSGVWGVSWQWRALVASWFEKCTLAAFF